MPFLVRLAVGREPVHRLDQLLEAERGPHLADEANVGVALVLELVGLAGLDGVRLAGAELDLLPADGHRQRAGDDLEPLALVRVDVLRGDEAVRADGRLDQAVLAVGLAGGLEEGQPLAGDRVDDGVSWIDHCGSLARVPFAGVGAAVRGATLRRSEGRSHRGVPPTEAPIFSATP